MSKTSRGRKPSMVTGTGLHSYIARLRKRAFACPSRIVLTDGADARILAAARTLVAESRIGHVLVGQTGAILPEIKKLGIAGAVDIYDPDMDKRQLWLVELLRTRFEERGKPVPPTAQLQAMASQPTYCSMLLVQAGLADGVLGGAALPTASVIRAGIQVAGVDPAHPLICGR